MSLSIVKSSSLLFRSPHDKGARIQKQPELTDGAVIALLAPWYCYIEEILRGTMG